MNSQLVFYLANGLVLALKDILNERLNKKYASSEEIRCLEKCVISITYLSITVFGNSVKKSFIDIMAKK